MGNSKANIYTKNTDGGIAMWEKRKEPEFNPSRKGHGPKGRSCKWCCVGVYRLLSY